MLKTFPKILFFWVFLCPVLLPSTAFSNVLSHINALSQENALSQSSHVSNHSSHSSNNSYGNVPNNLPATALSQDEAQKAIHSLIKKRQNQSLQRYQKEWDARVLKNGSYSMPFDIQIFGNKPADGRSLYISLHGGGGTTAQKNTDQWNNQKKLYRPKEGIYFVPRSPTDTWNMWHQEYMDAFIQKIIEMAVILEDVNPNKVYIMGYSAGGDGVYQLATRMPDLFAAAAMSAGHPGDASPYNLANLPFGIYVGGNDSAYDRNKLAKEWGDHLNTLSRQFEGNFLHDVHVYSGYGHWLELKDARSLPWMAQFRRNPVPEMIIWEQDDVLRDHFYWISATKQGKNKKAETIALYDKSDNSIIIADETNVKSLIININDAMLDLDKKITVYRGNKVIFSGMVPRRIENIQADVDAMRDKDSIFPAKILVEKQKAHVLP